jgi:transcriptional regulator with XRE-family HTH domain
MRNDRLREAFTALGLKVNELGPKVGVNPKTAQRWFYEGRVPRRTTADRVAELLGVPVDWLWPDIDGEVKQVPADLVRLYPNRLVAPRQLWLELVRNANSQIDILAVAGLSLIEDNPAIVALLRRRADDGVKMRITFSDTDSAAIRRRGGEEMVFDSLVHRAEVARDVYDPLFTMAGVEFRPHIATVYTTILRCDDQMLVSHHLYGLNGRLAPLLHLQRNTGDLFDPLQTSFDRVWHSSGSHIL